MYLILLEEHLHELSEADSSFVYGILLCDVAIPMIFKSITSEGQASKQSRVGPETQKEEIWNQFNQIQLNIHDDIFNSV